MFDYKGMTYGRFDCEGLTTIVSFSSNSYVAKTNSFAAKDKGQSKVEGVKFFLNSHAC